MPEDVQPLLSVLVPAMGAAMGNLGRNLHFFVFQDQVENVRLFSPFDPGAVVVKLGGRGRRQEISLSIDRPHRFAAGAAPVRERQAGPRELEFLSLGQQEAAAVNCARSAAAVIEAVARRNTCFPFCRY